MIVKNEYVLNENISKKYIVTQNGIDYLLFKYSKSKDKFKIIDLSVNVKCKRFHYYSLNRLNELFNDVPRFHITTILLEEVLKKQIYVYVEYEKNDNNHLKSPHTKGVRGEHLQQDPPVGPEPKYVTENYF